VLPLWRQHRREEHALTHTAVNRGELGVRFETPLEYVGYKLRDPLGQKIGSVQELFVNDKDEPEYVKVKMGFLGLKSVLIPVELLAVNTEHRSLILR
jgi:hypothetical protein